MKPMRKIIYMIGLSIVAAALFGAYQVFHWPLHAFNPNIDPYYQTDIDVMSEDFDKYFVRIEKMNRRTSVVYAKDEWPFRAHTYKEDVGRFLLPYAYRLNKTGMVEVRDYRSGDVWGHYDTRGYRRTEAEKELAHR